MDNVEQRLPSRASSFETKKQKDLGNLLILEFGRKI
jgi:hypothetical protein